MIFDWSFKVSSGIYHSESCHCVKHSHWVILETGILGPTFACSLMCSLLDDPQHNLSDPSTLEPQDLTLIPQGQILSLPLTHSVTQDNPLNLHNCVSCRGVNSDTQHRVRTEGGSVCRPLSMVPGTQVALTGCYFSTTDTQTALVYKCPI